MITPIGILFLIFSAVSAGRLRDYCNESGTSKTLGDTKVVGGENATKPIPYHVRLRVGESSCSGALIHEEWVVTSANCARHSTEPIVILGALDVSKNESTQILLKGNPPVIYPGYEPLHELSKDLALIKLEHPVNITDAIKPAKLPSADNPDYTDAVAQVTGWGHTGNNKPSSTILQKAESSIISNLDCQTFYGSRLVTDNAICIDGSDKKSICIGDAGDPLAIVNEKNEVVVVGVANYYGIYGCEFCYPSVFTRIGSFLDWINETIESN